MRVRHCLFYVIKIHWSICSERIAGNLHLDHASLVIRNFTTESTESDPTIQWIWIQEFIDRADPIRNCIVIIHELHENIFRGTHYAFFAVKSLAPSLVLAIDAFFGICGLKGELLVFQGSKYDHHF